MVSVIANTEYMEGFRGNNPSILDLPLRKWAFVTFDWVCLVKIMVLEFGSKISK